MFKYKSYEIHIIEKCIETAMATRFRIYKSCFKYSDGARGEKDEVKEGQYHDVRGTDLLLSKLLYSC